MVRIETKHCKIGQFNLIELFAVCNITIRSETVMGRSGQRYGEIKSSPGMKGPVVCWYRYNMIFSIDCIHCVYQVYTS